MPFDALIQESEELIQWADRKLDGLTVKSDTRERLSAGCLEVVTEHQKAVVVLVHKELYGSAFTLLRPIYEAYIRGLWLHKCATDPQLQKFIKGETETFGTMVAAVEGVGGYGSGTLSTVKQNAWKTLCGFTHTGVEQIVRRSTGSTIEPNYQDAEVIQAVNFSNSIGLLSAIAVCDVAGRTDIANDILDKIKELHQKNKV